MLAMTGVLILLAGSAFAASQCPAGYNDEHGIDVKGDTAFREASNQQPGGCTAQTKNGLPVPDPACTPGAFNPTVTADILTDPAYRTGCVRDRATKAAEKAQTYDWYGIEHPSNNHGANQVCELDHLVPLELGGADTLDNIWPQCGPSEAALNDRFFKQKDLVENYLAAMVKAAKADLNGARKCIAADWTQFLERAKQVCHGTQCNVGGEAQLDLSGC
jgi:hypothetical protein